MLTQHCAQRRSSPHHSCHPHRRAHSANNEATAAHDLPTHKCSQLSPNPHATATTSDPRPAQGTEYEQLHHASRKPQHHARILAATLSFLSQNTRTYRVIRRQKTDVVGLKTGSKTTMTSNRTAITPQSVAGLSSARLVTVPKHIAQRRHRSPRCSL